MFIQETQDSYSVEGPQRLLTAKTETMSIGTPSDFFVDFVNLARVERFKHLGSHVSRNCIMNEELNARIQSASCAVGRLRKRVFDCRYLTRTTRINVSLPSFAW